jgi:hypothetical protein
MSGLAQKNVWATLILKRKAGGVYHRLITSASNYFARRSFVRSLFGVARSFSDVALFGEAQLSETQKHFLENATSAIFGGSVFLHQKPAS